MLKAGVLLALFSQCAPDISPVTLQALTDVESSRKPYVIANVTDDTSHYFIGEREAIDYANNLKEQGKKYSAGLMQIYVDNFEAYGVTNETIFDHCKNIEVGADILRGCYLRASKEDKSEQTALRKAFSCYYSGNFIRGFKAEGDGKSYIDRIESKVTNAGGNYSVPEVRVTGNATETELAKANRKSGEAVLSVDDEKIGSPWDVFGDYKK